MKGAVGSESKPVSAQYQYFDTQALQVHKIMCPKPQSPFVTISNGI